VGTSVEHQPAIDAHVHFHPGVAGQVARVVDANNLIGVANMGSLERLGIPFEEGMQQLRDALGDRVVYFATPEFDDLRPGFGERMAEVLERKVEGGASGLKIFKELGLRLKDAEGSLIRVDDERLDPLWAKAGELGVPVLIHTADPCAFFLEYSPQNERWTELQLHPEWHFGKPGFPSHDELLEQRNRVIGRHPDTVFIGAHLGNYPENLSYVDSCLDRYANFYVDTSARIGEIGRHPATEVREFFVKHQERILFGTDWVLGWGEYVEGDAASSGLSGNFVARYEAHWRFFETDEQGIQYPEYPSQGQWTVDAIRLPGDVLSKLYRENAQRLIPRL